MATKTKPAPPAPPRLPSKDDLKQAVDQQGEEKDETSTVDDIRSDLEDAYQAIASAWEKLDQLDQG